MIRSLIALGLVAAAMPSFGASPDPRPAVIEGVRSNADGSSALSHSVLVPAAPEQVWDAIATARGWTTWAVPVAWVDPRRPQVIETSYNPAARPGDAMNIENEFTIRSPRERLVFRTIKAPAGFPHFEALAKVTQTFVLAPEGAGTRVTLTGTGYGSDEAGKAVLAFFRGGNRVSLEMLRDRFAKGPIDWSEKLKKPLK